MSVTLKVFLLIFTFCFLLFIFYFVKREKMSIRYSFLWIIAALIMIVFVLLSNPIIAIAGMLGFEVASNMIFFGGFMILLAITFSITAIVSKQSEKISKLSQQIALLCFAEWENKQAAAKVTAYVDFKALSENASSTTKTEALDKNTGKSAVPKHER